MNWRDSAKDVLAKLRPVVEPCTVPITRREQDTERPHGSGTLFKIDEHHFLVTAAHVAECSRHHGFPTSITDYRDKSDLVFLDECHIHYTKHENIDVAVYHLTDELVRRIPNRRFLRIEDVDFDSRPPSVYYLYGWPGELSSVDNAAEAVSISPFEYIMEAQPINIEDDSYDPELHIQVIVPDYDEGGISLTESARVRPKRLGGISGCSLWHVCRRTSDMRNWNPEQAKVVGVICSGDASEKTIRVSRWITVAGIIWYFFPEVRPAIQKSHADMANRIESLKATFRKYLLESASTEG